MNSTVRSNLRFVPHEGIFGSPLSAPKGVGRRLGIFVLAAVTTALGIDLMFEILIANGMTPLERAILVLFGVTFAWIVLAFWTAVAGFVLQLLGLDPLSLRRRPPRGHPEAPIVSRTALVMPIFNEDTRRVAAGLEATYRDLQATGAGEAFDAYVLSDTTDPEIAASEEAAVADLRQRLPGGERLYYRRRTSNEGCKAGNIADFCRQWGAYYNYMIVLDADSVMSGEALTGLVRTMQANPSAGMLQTVPIPVRQETFFGRFLQFAATLYSPMLATGMAFWQTDTANYWGHNAIIRVQAFLDHCGLPNLPGKPPLGGEILSHDFVEAALMRRGGWGVYLLPEQGGSFEEVPGNVLDYAQRDRRWAEGNFQHLRLLGAKGLHSISRLHFFMGALAFGASFLWFLMLTLSTIDAGARALTVVDYFGSAHQLFPDWPVARTESMITLLATVAALLILPKVFGLIICLLRRERRRAFGGGWKVSASAVLELLFSIIIAPVMMTFHALFVASILCGKRVRWVSQSREGRQVAWRTAFRRTGLAAFVGVFWGIGTALITPIFFWAMTPVLFGLVLAPLLVVVSSWLGLGRLLRRCGLFLAPSETVPPWVLQHLKQCLQDPPTQISQPAESVPIPQPRPRSMPTQRLDRGPKRGVGSTPAPRENAIGELAVEATKGHES